MKFTLLAYRDREMAMFSQVIPIQLELMDDIKETVRRAVLSGHIPNHQSVECYAVGTYEDKTGRITPFDQPLFIVDCADYTPIQKGEVIDGKGNDKNIGTGEASDSHVEKSA